MDTAATTPTANSQAEPRFRFANYYLTSGSRVKCIYILRITFCEGIDLLLLLVYFFFLFGLLALCDPITTWFVFCLFFFPLSTFPHHQDCFVCVWFLIFCVIRLIGLQAGSHECTDFSSRIVSAISSPHIFFLCNFPENFAKMREKTSRLPQKKPFKCPPLLVSLSPSQSTTASHTSQSFTSCKKVLSISFSTHFSFFFPSELIPSFLLLLLWLFGDE